jgi:hypothetical protein
MIQALRAPLTPVRSAVVIAAVALLGGVLGYLTAGGRAPQAVSVSPGETVAVRDVRLALPDGWATQGAAPPRALALPGARTLTGTFTDVVVAQAPAGGTSLLPARLLRSLRPPPPSPITAGGLTAWSYALALPGRGAPEAEVDAVPTTRGVVLLACIGPPSTVRAADCESGLRALRLVGARPLPPGPDAALLSTLPGVVSELSAARTASRERLAAGATPDARARAARELQSAYGRAAGALAPVAAGTADAVATLSVLRRLAARHAVLAGATAAQYAAGATTAVAAIRTDERALERLLGRWEARMASG